MWPWGHLALGYLCYAAYLGAWKREAPRGWPVVALAIGTQFPDVVDKPLAYWFGVLPEGRALMHSLAVFVPLALGLLAVAWYYGRTQVGAGFTIGWGSHLLGDSIGALQQGSYGQLSFLLWPIRPAPDYQAPDFLFHARKLLASLRELDVDALLAPGESLFVLELWLATGVLLLWVVQGLPPLGSLRRWMAATFDDHRTSR